MSKRTHLKMSLNVPPALYPFNSEPLYQRRQARARPRSHATNPQTTLKRKSPLPATATTLPHAKPSDFSEALCRHKGDCVAALATRQSSVLLDSSTRGSVGAVPTWSGSTRAAKPCTSVLKELSIVAIFSCRCLQARARSKSM